jgi:YidC/Oxa1 family membrane protein insertase
LIPHILDAAVVVHTSVSAAPHASTGVSCPYPTKIAGSSIWGPIARPLAAVLAWLYSLVPNYAFAIIAVGVIWTIIIAPLTLKSTRSMLAMQRLQPQMKKLQAEHKNDRMALNQAMQDLYKREGASPLGGCLPMLLPFPVFIALFDLIDGLSYRHLVNGVRCSYPRFLSPSTAMFHAIVRSQGRLDSFGMDLAKNALSSHPSLLAALPYFALLLIMIGTQYLQSAQMYSRNPSAQDNPQMKFMKYLPILFGIIFIRFPAGVILYYAASSLLRVFQQTLMYRFDPVVRRLTNKDLGMVEKEIAEIDAGNRPSAATRSSRGGPQMPSAPAKATGGTGTRLREALARQQEAAQARSQSQKEPSGQSNRTAPSRRPPSARPAEGATRKRVANPTTNAATPPSNGSARKATRAMPAAAPRDDTPPKREASTPVRPQAAPAASGSKTGSKTGQARTGARTGATGNRPTNPAGSGRHKQGR